MKLEEVLKLTEAGFTADEIRSMMTEPTQEPLPEKEPEEKPAEEPEEKPEELEETPAPKTEPDNAILKSLEDQIAKLTKAVQANNRLYAQNTPETEVKAEDILGTLIKGKEKKSK